MVGKNELIPKMRVCIVDSTLSDETLFDISKRCSPKVVSVELVKCSKLVSFMDPLEAGMEFDKCRSLALRDCDFNKYGFITVFRNLNSLEISACKNIGFRSLLESTNSLKCLEILKLRNLFHEPTAVKDFVSHMKQKELRILDLSENVFTGEDLGLLNDFLNNQSVNEFILTEWALKDNYDFSTFLSHSRLKKATLSLDQLAHINQFVESLSNNPTLLSVEVKANEELGPVDFSPFKNCPIKTLEELILNVKLPLWLIEMINENANKKLNRVSNICPVDDFKIKRKIFDISSGNEAFKIGLSLDGGGMRGLILASQLEYLCKEVKRPLHKIFDWIGGTSIGGILSLAATGTVDGERPICNTFEMKELFTKYGTKIFEKHLLQFLNNFTKSKYSSSGIEGVLSEHFKSCKLSDVLRDTNCIVTSVNRNGNTVKIFNSKEARLDEGENFYMRDVGRATSAAPIYFPSAEIQELPLYKVILPHRRRSRPE